MKIKSFVLYLLLIVAGFSSCEPKDTLYTKNIDNQTNREISFYLYGNFNPATYGDTIIVAPNEVKEIYVLQDENSNVTIQQPCNLSDDSIRVEISGGGILTKRMQDDNDWTFYSTSPNNQICSFVITDADIQ